jgi:hypothetical protein
VERLDVDLKDDRFDLRYDPRRLSPDRMLEAVRTLGFEGKVVDKPSGASQTATARVDPAALLPPFAALFARARREGRQVLLDFSAPG